MKDIPRYELDPETQEVVQTLLNLAAMMADCQIDEQARTDIFTLTDYAAEAFGIERLSDDDSEQEPLYGDDSTVIPLRNGPSLRIIDGSKDDPKNEP